jgi:hypothetical protein
VANVMAMSLPVCNHQSSHSYSMSMSNILLHLTQQICLAQIIDLYNCHYVWHLCYNIHVVRCLLTSILTTVNLALLHDTCWFTIHTSSGSFPARETCKAAKSKHFWPEMERQLSNTNAVLTETTGTMSSNVSRTHRGTQMGLSVNSRDSTPPGEDLWGNVLVRCKARRISLMAASTESLLV